MRVGVKERKTPDPKAYSLRGQRSRTLWMIPAEWIYYKRENRISVSQKKNHNYLV